MRKIRKDVRRFEKWNAHKLYEDKLNCIRCPSITLRKWAQVFLLFEGIRNTAIVFHDLKQFKNH
jgi:hypothetical protein